MFMIKIILFESVSVLLCVFHISFRAWSCRKIVRLFNLPTGKKNSGLTPGAVVTHQTWMLFLASSMRENAWKKDRSSQVQIRINLPLLFTGSSLHILIDLKGFTCHWRFVPRPQQLCSKSFLPPDIELSSSLCLVRYDNILIGKPVNVTIWQREGLQTCRSEFTNSCNVHQVSVPGYYSHYYYFFFRRPKFFYGDHFTIEYE